MNIFLERTERVCGWRLAQDDWTAQVDSLQAWPKVRLEYSISCWEDSARKISVRSLRSLIFCVVMPELRGAK